MWSTASSATRQKIRTIRRPTTAVPALPARSIFFALERPWLEGPSFPAPSALPAVSRVSASGFALAAPGGHEETLQVSFLFFLLTFQFKVEKTETCERRGSSKLHRGLGTSTERQWDWDEKTGGSEQRRQSDHWQSRQERTVGLEVRGKTVRSIYGTLLQNEHENGENVRGLRKHAVGD